MGFVLPNVQESDEAGNIEATQCNFFSLKTNLEIEFRPQRSSIYNYRFTLYISFVMKIIVKFLEVTNHLSFLTFTFVTKKI